MKLVDVYTGDYKHHVTLLWNLLCERTPEQSISHKEMPTLDDHIKFVGSQPYERWLLAYPDDSIYCVGSVYLTYDNEIGIFVFKQFHGYGHGTGMIDKLMELFPRGRYLANINPKNSQSLDFFERRGFKLIQRTYELSPTK